MIKLGAIKEVKLLMKKEKKLNKKNLIKTIGFKELKDFLLKKNDFFIRHGLDFRFLFVYI